MSEPLTNGAFLIVLMIAIGGIAAAFGLVAMVAAFAFVALLETTTAIGAAGLLAALAAVVLVYAVVGFLMSYDGGERKRRPPGPGA